jgi:hypothetical protein
VEEAIEGMSAALGRARVDKSSTTHVPKLPGGSLLANTLVSAIAYPFGLAHCQPTKSIPAVGDGAHRRTARLQRFTTQRTRLNSRLKSKHVISGK